MITLTKRRIVVCESGIHRQMSCAPWTMCFFILEVNVDSTPALWKHFQNATRFERLLVAIQIQVFTFSVVFNPPTKVQSPSAV